MSVLPGNILQQMLAAAAKAAGAQWGTISGDVGTWAKSLAEEGESIASDLANNKITAAEAKVEFDGIADAAAMIANFADQAAKTAAQNAANAAIGVLWAAIQAAIP